MIRGELEEVEIFDKANAAAKAAMKSVVDLANQTGTPVIVFRNGQIERLSPAALAIDREDEGALSKPGSTEL